MQFLAPGGRQRLGVGQAVELGAQHHGGDHQRTGAGPTARLVYPGDGRQSSPRERTLISVKSGIAAHDARARTVQNSHKPSGTEPRREGLNPRDSRTPRPVNGDASTTMAQAYAGFGGTGTLSPL
ncbi:hypothetical protein Ssi03_10760 [Sphaerisporangium siamense]|nr:hypothetical protein Ssi03_10760 [Sphaerisporangium siamense]